MSTDRRTGVDRRSIAEQERPITVVLVDEEAMARTGIAHVLAKSGLEVIGEVGSAAEAIDAVVDLRPDVVVTGLGLPDGSGVETIARLGILAPASPVLVLSRSTGDGVVEAIVAGASGYILKSASPEAIVSAVKATAAGESVLSPQIAGKLLEHIRRREARAVVAGNITAEVIRSALTERELQIFQLLASGRSNPEIGRDLTLSANTVSNHIKSILAKLQLENRIQAAVHAVRSGIS
jgi:DNA-binding NarL/FixJ family response regulator